MENLSQASTITDLPCKGTRVFFCSSGKSVGGEAEQCSDCLNTWELFRCYTPDTDDKDGFMAYCLRVKKTRW